MDAVRLLNADCWRVILKKLCPKDLYSCSLTCSLFRRITSDDYEFHEVEWKFDLILPHLILYLRNEKLYSTPQILPARLVCKRWLTSIDNLHSERTIEAIKRDYFLTFYGPGEIEDFLLKFENKMPVMSRSIRLCLIVWSAEPEYILQAISLVEACGNLIWNLELCGSWQRTTIMTVLNNLPNIRYFYLEANRMRLIAPEYECLFPDLKYLNSFTGKGMNDEVGHLIFQKYGPQLKTIMFDDVKFSMMRLEHFMMFKTVKKLTIHCCVGADTLEPLRWIKCPLETLDITFFFTAKLLQSAQLPFPLNIDRLMWNIKHLPIKFLSIRTDFPMPVRESGIPLKKYINNSITHYKLRCSGISDYTFISFNYLQALKKLKYFEFIYLPFNESHTILDLDVVTHPKDLPEEVKLLRYIYDNHDDNWDRAYKSNIWEKVAKLKELKVYYGKLPSEKISYTRKGYEAYQKKRWELWSNKVKKTWPNNF